MGPLPKGYASRNHETIGSDILALYQALQLPELVLGKETATRIQAMKVDAWYPIAALLEPLELLGTSIGDAGLRKVGRTLFQKSHAERAKQNAKSARDVLMSFDAIYRNANRGDGIGGWRVLRFDAEACELEKATPHHCALEEGIILEAMRTMNAPARVEQTACVRTGAPNCIFRITPFKSDTHWSGQ